MVTILPVWEENRTRLTGLQKPSSITHHHFPFGTYSVHNRLSGPPRRWFAGSGVPVDEYSANYYD